MLVLTRKVGERILIGDDIVVQVVEFNRGSVKLGIEAPESVSIFRYEVYERIQQENRVSSKAGDSFDIIKAAEAWRRSQG
jgi:carbon storage regulator